MTRRRGWILAGATLGVLVAALAAWWAPGAIGHPARPAGRHAGAAPAAASVASADESAQAVDTLIGRLPAAFASGDDTLLSSATRARGADLRQALPAGAHLAMDRSAWRRTGVVGSATATMTVAGRPPVRFVVLVIREDGAWRVSSTYEAGAA